MAERQTNPRCPFCTLPPHQRCSAPPRPHLFLDAGLVGAAVTAATRVRHGEARGAEPGGPRKARVEALGPGTAGALFPARLPLSAESQNGRRRLRPLASLFPAHGEEPRAPQRITGRAPGGGRYLGRPTGRSVSNAVIDRRRKAAKRFELDGHRPQPIGIAEGGAKSPIEQKSIKKSPIGPGAVPLSMDRALHPLAPKCIPLSMNRLPLQSPKHVQRASLLLSPPSRCKF